jgi:S1-C subfamily serine protease
VQVQKVTPDIADRLGLKQAEGALVAELRSNAPAAKAGIVSGDVITPVNSQAVRHSCELARSVAATAWRNRAARRDRRQVAKDRLHRRSTPKPGIG